MATFTGTAGNNTFTGGGGADTFNMGLGGDDTVDGKNGADVFNFGASLTAADKIDGGNGGDIVNLAGNYSGGNALTFGATTMINVETLVLSGGPFALTMNDANAEAGTTLTIDARALTAAQSLTFDGSAEDDTGYVILAGAGDAFLTGSRKTDTFSFGANFKTTDHVDGGGGSGDTLKLDGDYSLGLVFAAGTIRNLATIAMAAGHDYFLTLDNANVLLTQTMTIDASALASVDSLIFDGSDETSSRLTIKGGAGNDRLVGGGGKDIVDPGAGRDIVDAGDGDDVISMFANLTIGDLIDAGDGNDIVQLSGDYSSGLSLGANTLRNVERLTFAAGGFYNITLAASAPEAGQTFFIDARALGPADGTNVDAAAVTDGRLIFFGGAPADFFTLGQSGFDTFKGGGSDDIVFAHSLSETDRIDGGAGTGDTLNLDGDYSDHLDFQSRTIRGVESIGLFAGQDYDFATADGNVAAGATLTILGAGLAAGDVLTFDGSKETNGGFIVNGGAGNDVITTGKGNDVINTGNGTNFVDLSRGGSDTVTGGTGNDTFAFGASFDSTDIVDPGDGTDTLSLDGNYSTGTPLNIAAFEKVTLGLGHSYNLAVATAPTNGMTLIAGLGDSDHLFFTGSGDRRYIVHGGSGNDVLKGGNGNDTFLGKNGNDTLTGGGGKDTIDGGDGDDRFVYEAVSDSTGINFDSVDVTDFDRDKFDLPFTGFSITGIDAAVIGGTLSTATFDTDLAAALNGHLLAHHAIIFDPDAGDQTLGDYLVVDINGTAGYQTGADLVIRIFIYSGVVDEDDFI